MRNFFLTLNILTALISLISAIVAATHHQWGECWGWLCSAMGWSHSVLCQLFPDK